AALADDVAIALACGVRDLWLFDLGGVLARGGPEVWLRALVDPSPAAAPPAPTARSRALSAAMWAAGAALSLASAALRPAHPGEEIAEHGTPPPRLW
ncbi:MAG: hypothetical protein R3B70_49510, partial [Polyangiaceae bacterium]